MIELLFFGSKYGSAVEYMRKVSFFFFLDGSFRMVPTYGAVSTGGDQTTTLLKVNTFDGLCMASVLLEPHSVFGESRGSRTSNSIRKLAQFDEFDRGIFTSSHHLSDIRRNSNRTYSSNM